MRFLLLFVALSGFSGIAANGQELLKTGSTLYPPETMAAMQRNAESDPWAATVREKVVEAAAFWKDMDNDELWDLMFGPQLPRSWMVWSDGHSPVTGEPVPMYNWVVDAKKHPWKVQDPTSGEWFPKNDFKAYYESGLDEAGLFREDAADKSLLFNTEHPNPDDPLHQFGVDDGHGYVNDKGERWRFIAAYLIYGQWKQLVVGGVRTLSAAYALTGEPVYARKAGILLDRIADLYPGFDFKEQGILYEGPGSAGYVSTWHDTCEETRELVMSYDMIFNAIKTDTALVDFLSAKSAEAGLENPKATFSHIQRNIESRILRDALAHPAKIHSNYPRAEILKAITVAVLQEPEKAFWAYVDPMMEQSTAVDGVTGEKGLAGYASFTLSALANFLAEFSRADPDFLPRMLERFPGLKDTYRFHIDTYCLERYYPLIGDTGHFAAPMDRYVAMLFTKPGENVKSYTGWTLLNPSSYKFLWDLYKATGDEAYVQVLYRENGGSTDGLPYDIFGNDPSAFRQSVEEVIAEHGDEPKLESVNKEEWHLAILRDGTDANERALWIDYDAGGGHGHQDGMNLGLFAHGLDLMPEFGYPPVQFGGWGSERARWYTKSAAHNTLVIDEANQTNGAGVTTMWHDGAVVKVIRTRGDEMAQAERFERTSVMVSTGVSSFYIVDVFRVRGGSKHTKFQHSHFGALRFEGLNREATTFFPDYQQMRNAQIDADAQPGWRADWVFEDKYELLDDDEPRGMRYWDFTQDATAGSVDGWIVVGMYGASEELWIPRIVVEREAEAENPLASVFVAVLEPWKGSQSVAGVERTEAVTAQDETIADGDVALTVELSDGRRDRLLLRDAESMNDSPAAAFGDGDATSDGELAFLRANGDETIEHVAVIEGDWLEQGSFRFDRDDHDGAAEYSPN